MPFYYLVSVCVPCFFSLFFSCFPVAISTFFRISSCLVFLNTFLYYFSHWLLCALQYTYMTLIFYHFVLLLNIIAFSIKSITIFVFITKIYRVHEKKLVYCIYPYFFSFCCSFVLFDVSRFLILSFPFCMKNFL